jgi:pimeloyl-ACP methyl ester carboxylesterase
VDQVPEGCDKERTPTLLCIHGFPDLWYGWRYQIRPWVNRGYRVIAPDMLGYGGSSKPEDVAEYTTKKLCADLVALLDRLNIGKAVYWLILSQPLIC